MNKNTLTVFAIDDDSDVFVLLRVNYNKLRDSLKKSLGSFRTEFKQ